MRRLYAALFVLLAGLFGAQEISAQSASATWPLSNSSQLGV